ncbi:MAG: ferrous iron transport protein A [Planctomycetes bacterium]|nr:ferrous iron transport protein A [Planctomycetota bacterium]
MPRTLDSLHVGESCTVRSVRGDPLTAQRFREMGLVAGASVRLVRRAPLGDPMELCVHGYHLAVRGDDARAIEVDASNTP